MQYHSYTKQNIICLKLVLLPFTVTFWAIKKLATTIKKRHMLQKHQLA